MKKILLTFRENAEGSGPYQSHKRIMESNLKNDYNFIPLYLPIPKKILKPDNFIKFVRQIRAENPDIMHIHGLQIEGFCLLLLAKFAGVKKIVCAVRGSSNEAIEFVSWKRYIVNKMEKYTLKHSDMVYGVSDYVSSWNIIKDNAKKYYGTIYNFPDLVIENTSKEINRKKIKNEFNINDDCIVVVSTGRITKEKGYDIYKEIIKRFSKRKDVVFLVVGNGNYLDEMKENLVTCKNVVFTGYRKDISEILDASDIYVTPTYHETLGNSIIEAENHCLPVVASKVGGVPEIVRDKSTGFLVNVGSTKEFCDKILLLVENADLRKKMGQEGCKYILSKFSNEKIESSLFDMYEQTFRL